MARKNLYNTRAKIVSAAWKLFYEQGYDNTTIDEIIDCSGTSRGSFYHYFTGKDNLLSTLSLLFDQKYEELVPKMDDSLSCFDKLLFLNKELFSMIEDTVPLDLLARLYSSQLITSGEKHLLDHNRIYYKLLRKIVSQAQESGEIKDGISVNEVIKAYALYERAILYDWCICNGEYSLSKYSESMLPLFLNGFQK